MSGGLWKSTIDRTVRVGVLGAGHVAEVYHLPVLDALPGVRIEWCCDADRTRAAVLARRWRIPGAFESLEECGDVDVVLVAIPVGARRASLETIFGRGWHAFVEKPFALSVEDHQWILMEANRAGVEVGVCLMRRSYRSTLMAQRILREGLLGPVLEIWAAEGTRMRSTGRGEGWYQENPEVAGGGVLLETGSHLLDQVFVIVGAAAFGCVRASFREVEGIDIEARAVASLDIGSYEHVSLAVAVSRISDLRSGIAVRCTRGAVHLGVTADSVVELASQEGEPICRLDSELRAARNTYQAFFLQWEAFLEQCRSRTRSLADAESGLLCAAFIQTAYGTGSRL